MATNASITVRFETPGANGANAGETLSAEVDGRTAADGGLNNGVTQFSPGSRVAILLYRSATVQITTATSSAGSISKGYNGQITVKVKEDVTFVGKEPANLSKIPIGGLLVEWMGKAFGSVNVVGNVATASGARENDIALANITYYTKADVYYLQSPNSIDGNNDFTIAVLFVGKVVTP